MAYVRTTWENGITPINAENLNNIEEGINETKNEIQNTNSNLGKVAAKDIVPISMGGTNATSAEAAAKKLGYTKQLLSIASFMKGSLSYTLSEAVSAQPHGIILVFSPYEDGGSVNYSWQSFFVPKAIVANQNGTGHIFELTRSKHYRKATKYIYISDTTIRGSDENEETGTASGISYTNTHFVLRYVYGV